MFQRILPAVLLAGFWALGPTTVRADKLDVGLLQKSNDVLDKLFTAKVKMVGVLPFRVQKGTEKASFIAAPICVGMRTRLENALIMNNSLAEKETIGILTQVGLTATRARVGAWFEKGAERAKLFTLNYPMAWGTLKAEPDALLTGEIVNKDDRTKTTVKIEAIFANDPKKELVKLVEFTVDTDSGLMGDLGYNFSLSKVARRGRGDNRATQVASLVRRRSPAEPAPEGVEVASSEDVGGMSVGIQYDGKPVKIEAVSIDGANKEYHVPPMKAGSKFTMTLTYNDKQNQKLGVIVKLNGKSSFMEEEGDSLLLRKWLYTAEKYKGKADLYEGFTYEGAGNNVKLFKVLDAKESANMEKDLGERAGWIDVDIFATKEPGKEDAADEHRLVTLRGRSKSTPTTPEEAQALVLKDNNLTIKTQPRRHDLSGPFKPRAKTGGYIVPDDKATQAVELSFGNLPNPIQIGSLRIKYLDDKVVLTPDEE